MSKGISTCERAGNEVMDLSRFLWIQHTKRIVYFTPKEGFEKKEFKSQKELMEFTEACIGSGYYIG